MEESELITIVTSDAAILRYMNGISEQKTPLTLSTTGTEDPKEYQSSVLRIEKATNQIVLHQIMSGEKRDFIKPEQDIEITCHMRQGTIKFTGSLSPLEDSEDNMYYQVTIPRQISKRQLRSSFRVSLLKYDSTTSVEVEEGVEIFGTCWDISLAGALFNLSGSNSKIKRGQVVEQCRLRIADTLDITCSAKVCHVSRTATNRMLVGLEFPNLERDQLKSIKSATNKLERLNITK